MIKDRKVVLLKKVWIHGSIVGGIIFLVLIFYNFYQAAHLSAHHGDANQDINLFANDGDISWYHNNLILKDVSANQAQSDDAKMSPSKTLANTLPVVNEGSTEPLSSMVSPDVLTAMAAPISSNQLKPESSPHSTYNDQAQISDLNTLNNQAVSVVDQSNHLQNPPSPYVIQAGTLIPGILMTGIYSDLPGPIIAQVRTPVYDSISGKHLLIPQGSKLMGVYDTQVAYGQERIMVVWKRLLLPNGQSIDLSSMPSVDMSGTAGFYDHTNHHYTRVFGSAVLTSVLGAGVAYHTSSHRTAIEPSLDPSSLLSKSIGESAMQTGLKLIEKNMDLSPTIEIRPGYHFQLVVTQDMVFESPYRFTFKHS